MIQNKRSPAHRPWRKFFVGVVVLFIVLVLVLHVVVGPLCLWRINHRLQSIPGYEGHVESLRFGWLTPSVRVQHITLAKRDRIAPGAVISAATVDAHFFWTDLLRGHVVLDIALEKPSMLFLMRERRVGQPNGSGLWRKPFERFPPFRVNEITIRDGILRFKNDDALPPIDVSFTDMDLTATSIANRVEEIGPGVVHVEGRALMQGQAPVSITLRATPFREHAQFDVQGTLSDFDLTAMNSIMNYYTGLKLEKGSLSMTLHETIRDGAFSGRVQRTIDQLTIQKTDHGVIKHMKEDVAQAWLDWHEERHTDRLDKEFDYAGPLGYLDNDAVLAAVWVVKGAFIQSIKANVKSDVRTVTPEQALDEWATFQAKQRKKAHRTD